VTSGLFIDFRIEQTVMVFSSSTSNPQLRRRCFFRSSVQFCFFSDLHSSTPFSYPALVPVSTDWLRVADCKADSDLTVAGIPILHQLDTLENHHLIPFFYDLTLDTLCLRTFGPLRYNNSTTAIERTTR
jgi:hypothetical protein